MSLQEKLRRPKVKLKITSRKRKLLEDYREREDYVEICVYTLEPEEETYDRQRNHRGPAADE